MEFKYACDKCPRTFKLEEFFLKHQRVHQLKKQHKCHICGFVYGAAKGLEGHLKTHELGNNVVTNNAINGDTGVNVNKDKSDCPQSLTDVSNKSAPAMDYLFLNARGVLSAQAEAPKIVSNDVDISKVSKADGSVGNCRVISYGDTSKGGTGVYKIYDSVPDLVSESECVRDAQGHFVCPICGRSFTGLNSLRKHLPIHTRSVQHACHICGQVFGKRDYLIDHIKAVHSGPGSWMENNVANVAELSQMLNSPNANLLPPNIQLPSEPLKTLSCHLCVEKFVLKSELHAHLENSHRLPILSCASCGEKFADILELQDHITKQHSVAEPRKPTKTTPKPCSRRPGPASRTRPSLPTSNSSSRSSSQTQKRISHHELYGGPKFSASEVVERVMAEAKANRGNKGSNHHHSNVGGPGASVVCTVCDQAFPNPSSLRNHVVNVHVNQQEHTCDLCGKAFLSQVNLEDHVKTKHPNMKKKLQSLARGLTSDEAASPISPSIAVSETSTSSCLSPKLFSSTSLSLHTTSLSSSLSPTNASDLTNSPSLLILSAKRASFINNNNNNEEEESKEDDAGSEASASKLVVSTGRKRHSVCKVCGVVLSPKTNVNVHMRTHSGARPYQCVLCLNRFRQKAHLMKHFRCSHNQKRPPFVCQFCSMHAASSNDLYRHIADNHQRETQQLTRKMKPHPEDNVAGDGAQLPVEPTTVTHDETNVMTDVDDNNDLEHNHKDDLGVNPDAAVKAEVEPEAEAEVEIEAKAEVSEDPVLETNNDTNDVASADDDVRYEAIMEPFLFEEQVIHPCYVVLPFVNKEKIKEASHSPESDDSGDEDRLTIDESLDVTTNVDSEAQDEEVIPGFDWRLERPGPKSVKIAAAQRRRLNEDMAKLGMQSRAEARKRPAPADDLNEESSSSEPAVYPKHAVLDFGLPFTLTNLWNKKADELSPQMMHQLELWKKMEEIRAINEDARQDYHNNNNSSRSKEESSTRRRPREKKKRKASDESNVSSFRSSRTNSSNDEEMEGHAEESESTESACKEGETSTVVSAYEKEIQNDRWPVRCIKCNVKIKNLDEFNVHMNEHWSEDKCCPVCGLLINSKRFNFKQHLKIHTGEKPFVCNICNRSFRQKAHMVKHVTTHRTVITNGAIANHTTVSVK